MSGAAGSYGTGGGLAVAPSAVAPVGVRVGAFTVDAVAAGAVAGLAYTVAGLGGAGGLTALLVADAAALVLGVGQWVAEATTGATLGGALLRIRTLSGTTGRPAGLARIFLRQLVIGLGSLVCGFGAWVVAASGAWDKGVAQRGWHDKAAGTIVLRAGARAGSVPSDPAGSYASAVARAVGALPPATVEPTPTPTPAPAPPAVPSVPTAPVPAPPTYGAPVSHAAPVPVPPVPTPPTYGPPVPAPPPYASPVPAPPAYAAPVPAAEPPAPPRYAAPPMPSWASPPADLGDVPSPYTGTTPVVAPLADAARPVEPAPATPPQDRPPDRRSARRAAQADDGLIAAPPGYPAASDGIRRVAVPPAPAPVPLCDDLGDLEHTRLRTAEPPAGLRLAFDTGEVVDVTGDGLVGRNPGAHDGVAHVVAIDDPDRSVSKVHLAFGPQGAAELWVVDRGSTNGTVLVRPDGARATLPAGSRATIGAGWAVRFGERTVRVEAR